MCVEIMSETITPDPDQKAHRDSYKKLKRKVSVQLEEGVLHSGKGAFDRLENIKLIAGWLQNGYSEEEIMDSQIYSHRENTLREYIKLAHRWINRVNHPAPTKPEGREKP